MYQSRNEQFSDAMDSMLKLVELNSSHRSKGGVSKLSNDKGGRWETLHWSDDFSSLFLFKCVERFLVDSTDKTDIYDLNLVVKLLPTLLVYRFQVDS